MKACFIRSFLKGVFCLGKQNQILSRKKGDKIEEMETVKQ